MVSCKVGISSPEGARCRAVVVVDDEVEDDDDSEY